MLRSKLPLDVTVEEGLKQLGTLCATEMKVDGGARCLRISTPRSQSRALLEAARIHLPEALPHREVRVVTRKELPARRQPR